MQEVYFATHVSDGNRIGHLVYTEDDQVLFAYLSPCGVDTDGNEVLELRPVSVEATLGGRNIGDALERYRNEGWTVKWPWSDNPNLKTYECCYCGEPAIMDFICKTCRGIA